MSTPRRTMRVRDLRNALEGIDDSMLVLVRVHFNDGDDCEIGGAFQAEPDAGCTDVDAFIISGDADEGENPDEALESDEIGSVK